MSHNRSDGQSGAPPHSLATRVSAPPQLALVVGAHAAPLSLDTSASNVGHVSPGVLRDGAGRARLSRPAAPESPSVASCSSTSPSHDDLSPKLRVSLFSSTSARLRGLSHDDASHLSTSATTTAGTAADGVSGGSSSALFGYARRYGGRRLLHLLLLGFLLLTSLACALLLTMREVTHVDAAAQTTPRQAMLPSPPWSVLVRHSDALTRLGPAIQRRCTLFFFYCRTTVAPPLVLPSWTLHVVDPRCTECLDRETYADAFPGKRRTSLPAANDGAVFATASAPLGRVGSMLLAMSSVTNMVSVTEEVPKWKWMQYTWNGVGTDNGQQRSPYLAVMGIPSTDQPVRAGLRQAQRETWMSFSEVARASNHFQGALLPLYLFAGVEPMPVTRTEDASQRTPSSVYFNSTHLLPTQQEFLDISAMRHFAALLEAQGGTGEAAALPPLPQRPSPATYSLPRVVLREKWLTEGEWDSPCVDLVRVTADGTSAATEPLLFLSPSMSLPIAPAVVSAANYICHASAALWKEALTHRNVVWIDMMTDRRPTTNKKLGENKKWGLPVEVGMSQKLILWLEYAYHAFPGVPYIMKGDDDAYLKVPQFLNDVRFIVRGRGVRYLARNETLLMPREAPVLANESICTYWGSTRSFSGTRFNAGMAFLLHRRVAQAVLEPATKQPSAASFTAATQSSQDQRDHVQLAMMEFNPSLSEEYVRLEFHHEDVMLGFLIRSRLAREQAMCPYHKMFYVKETFTRFHDLRVGRARKLTWASVVVHRCHVTDFSFVHYFFMHEYNRTAPASATLAEEEAAAQAAAAAWVAEKKAQMPMYDTWDSTPDVQWVSRGNGPVAPAYVVDPQDAVAVYMHSYNELHQPQFHVYDGYVSDP
jgi:phosphoglycan beta-1,3-galactosyltransferase